MLLLWYALRVGLDYQTAMTLPLTLILDLARVHQIKTEGAVMRQETYEDLEIIPDIP